MTWHTLNVSKIDKPTSDCTTLYFDVPQNLAEAFRFQAGQHIKVQVNIGNQTQQRCYSVVSHDQRQLAICVKSQGVVSSYLNQKIEVGSSLAVSEPAGLFTLETCANARKSYYFFAAGSGITPIFTMINRVLQHEPHSYVYLLYANKNAKSTLFFAQFNALAQQESHRFVLKDCHSDSSWFSSYSPWRSGRINAKVVQQFISENKPYAQDCEYYICGSGEFTAMIKNSLTALDVPASRMFSESFTSASKVKTHAGQAATLTVTLNQQTHQLQVKPQQTLLQAMKNQQLNPPSSCESGVCGACICQLTEGEVDMANNMVLDETQLKQGKILACQSVAKTNQLTLQYE